MANSPYVVNAQGYSVSGAPTASYGSNYFAGQNTQNNQPNGATLWNTAWNQGYNAANSSTNPYSGQNVSGYDIGAGYLQGQRQYITDRGSVSPSANNNQITNIPTGNIPTDVTPSLSGEPAPDPYAQVKNDINSGYDSYFASLNDQLNGYLPGQYSNQLDIVNNSYNQGVSDLGYQKETGLADLTKSDQAITTNQRKSLTSLSDNMRNMFQAGNVYLGSRGAGDSSAANQYSYALNKLGNQARGDVMSQANTAHQEVADKQYRLGQLFNQEVNKLRTEADNNKLSVAQWFADSQQQIKNAIASGELSRSTDIANLSRSLLDSALNKLSLAQTEASNRRSALESWAMSTSQNLAQLKTNMAGISQYTQPTFNSQIQGGQPYVDSSGNYHMPVGYGSTDTTKKVNGLFD